MAVYADEEAVINSSDHDSNNDDVWIANEEEMPELEMPVRLSASSCLVPIENLK